MWDEICKFFGWAKSEPEPKKSGGTQYSPFMKGCLYVDGARVQMGCEGAMRFEIPEHRVKELWHELRTKDDGSGFYVGMRDRLHMYKHPDPFDERLNVVIEIPKCIPKHWKQCPRAIIDTDKHPMTKAARTRKFYRLVARAPVLSSEEFAREFRAVFRDYKDDDSICNTMLERMLEDDSWIAYQHTEFAQYNKFANKQPRTMEAFLTARGDANTVNN